jgi:transcriptional regulator with XRE-family HTH domain
MTEEHNHLIANIRAEINSRLAIEGIKTKDISVKRFATLLNISKSYSWEILNGTDFNPKISSLLKIANALNITVLDLLKD